MKRFIPFILAIAFSSPIFTSAQIHIADVRGDSSLYLYAQGNMGDVFVPADLWISTRSSSQLIVKADDSNELSLDAPNVFLTRENDIVLASYTQLGLYRDGSFNTLYQVDDHSLFLGAAMNESETTTWLYVGKNHEKPAPYSLPYALTQIDMGTQEVLRTIPIDTISRDMDTLMYLKSTDMYCTDQMCVIYESNRGFFFRTDLQTGKTAKIRLSIAQQGLGRPSFSMNAEGVVYIHRPSGAGTKWELRYYSFLEKEDRLLFTRKQLGLAYRFKNGPQFDSFLSLTINETDSSFLLEEIIDKKIRTRVYMNIATGEREKILSPTERTAFFKGDILMGKAIDSPSSWENYRPIFLEK